MSSYDSFSRFMRAFNGETGSSIPVEVVAVGEGKSQTVSVKPLMKTVIRGFDGESSYAEPLQIDEIPYHVINSGDFAMFMPPKVGMRGVLINTNSEIGEIETGDAKVSRVKDRAGGVFMPIAMKDFNGNSEWFELRSRNCRVAVSANMVHIEANGNSFAIDSNGFEIKVNGISIIEALKQMSDHIGDLEERDGGTRKDRKVDDLIAAQVPNRQEGGV